jgi:hypothetical protein
LLSAAALVAVLAACGSSGDSDQDIQGGRNSPVVGDLTVVEIPTRWATANAQDMKTLLASSDAVFVGEVAGLIEQRNVEFGGPTSAADAPPAANPGKDAVARRASVPISVFQVTIVRSIAGGLTEGQKASVEQPGGVITRSDGSQAQVVLDGDELLTPGTKYLFFASVKGNGALTSAPFARFTVRDGESLAPLDGWSGLPVARQLNDRSVDEAADTVRNAR